MQEALAYQKEHRDKRVGQILIELNFVTEQQVLEALASRLELEIVDVASQQVDLEAVAMVNKELAEKNLFLPLSVTNRTMVLVTNDPLNYFALEEVRQQTGCYLQILLSEEKPLRQAISYYFAEVGAKQAATEANAGFGADDFDDLDLTELENVDEEAPIIHLLNSLVERAIKSNASDIHIEPFERQTKVRMRIDGVILEYVALQRNVHQPLIARIKIMANLDIAEKRIPQDGHFRVRTESGYVNIRVSLMPTVFGEKAVLRLLTSSGQLDYPDQFGMDDDSYRKFLPMLNSSNGIIYITGPTGSGKSTTLYMVLEYLSGRMLNIATIEDPVEKNVPGINQTQVNPVAGLTFEMGLRALLRQDPDVIMVGETRDGETAGISVRAAITGHVVLSTLHTNSAASSIVRLEDMGVETYLVANSMVGVVAQRLMRKVCPHCAQEMETTPEEREFLGENIETVWRGRGCAQCNNTGYRGRIAVHEIFTVDAALRQMIGSHASMEEIENYARERQQMRTLKENGIRLVADGVTTIEELAKIAYGS
ncbi:type II secretion system protein GspE [Lachnospiraceae bacterium WCA-9-b2]|jgi:Type II secretory pathway, ATPase PulE/Tfp pilus assembly pathway, ATPase PilB|uniref:Type II secretion system protein GspE n=2 Tax=Sporofaciens musculi TaxID=2681861 RepID=A0A7X3MLZ9_9FIRM|nr:type II/IV secretion system protein [Dorea sp.]MXP78824.1 type II secretion system protein GspE [Sporofaciens musculi]